MSTGTSTGTIAALLLLAAAVLLSGGTAAARLARLQRPPSGPAPEPTGRTAGRSGELALGWRLLAVCLEAGLPVSAAVITAAQAVDGPLGARLNQVAALLTLGADPATAWASAQEVTALAPFARAAGRSGESGSALAHLARAEASRLRAELADAAQARAQRAAVLITAPLGLCFLPSFLVLGIAPVVIGLARQALPQW